MAKSNSTRRASTAALCALLLTPAVCGAQTAIFQPRAEVQTLLETAIKARNAAQYDAALKIYTEAGEKARSLSDRIGEANARLGAGNTYYLMQNYSAAITAFGETIAIKQQIGDRAGIARAQVNLGNAYQRSGESQKSRESYEQALPVLKEFGEKRDQARALNGLGGLLLAGGDLPRAQASCEESLAIAHELKDDGGIAEAANNLGTVYQKQNQIEKALASYQAAAAIFHRLGIKNSEAQALSNIGGIYQRQGKRQLAIPVFAESLPLYHVVGNTKGEAATLTYQAGLLAEAGETEKARAAYESALALFRSIPDPKSEAQVLDQIGGFYRTTGSPRKALPFYEQAAAAYTKIGDTLGVAQVQVHQADAAQDINDTQSAQRLYDAALATFISRADKAGQAQALTGKAGVYSLIGDAGKSLGFYQQALPLTKGTPDEAPAYLNVGSGFLGAGDAGTALIAYQEALRQYIAQNDVRGAAAARVDIGDTYRIADQPKEAIPYYEQALPVFKERQDKRETAITLRNLGAAYAVTGETAKGIAAFEEALPLFRAVQDRLDEAATLGNLGTLYLLIGQPEKAQPYFAPSLLLCREIGNQRGEANALVGLSQVAEAKGDLPTAETQMKSGIDVLEKIRLGIGDSTESKLTFLASIIEPYQRYVHILIAQKKFDAAFATAQKTKARTLLDLMEQGHVTLAGSLTPTEREQEQTLRKRTDDLNQQMLREAVLNEEGAKARFAGFKQEIVRAEGELATFMDSLYAQHPELGNKRMVKTVILDDMAALLPDHTALLEYVTLQTGTGKNTVEEVALFVVTSESGKANLTVYPIAAKGAELAKAVDDFRAACTDYQKPYRPQAQMLYKLLIAPALPSLIGKTRLIIAPSGILWDVPFAALMDDKNQFLIASREIDYTYSATTVQSAALIRADTSRAKPTGSLLVVANPDFGDASRFGGRTYVARKTDTRGIEMVSRVLDAPNRGIEMVSRNTGDPSRGIEMVSRGIEMVSRGIEMVSRDGKIVPLPGTQAEADVLKKDFPDATIYTQKQAQESTLKAEAGNYKYVHLASHAFFNSAAPMLSSVILATPSAGSKDDGLLTAREIFDLHLCADLVVLSACNTARGEKRGGEGIVGLTWALFAAGAPSQVLSQWSVNDTSTAALMEKFYAGLSSGADKGTALHDAALALSQDKSREHPYFWAPFILMGDWRK